MHVRDPRRFVLGCAPAMVTQKVFELSGVSELKDDILPAACSHPC